MFFCHIIKQEDVPKYFGINNGMYRPTDITVKLLQKEMWLLIAMKMTQQF